MAKSKQLARMTKEEGHEGVVKVSVLGKDSIILGRNMHSYIWDDLLNNLAYSTTFVLITDSNLQRLHMKKYVETFNQAIEAKYGKTGDQGASTAGSGSVERPRLLTLVIKPGESSKNRSTKAELEDWMLKEGCTRDTVVMALGGGVIGDLVGFVAATFMRGVRFIQLPTSLLAMVDSSVGGKTAIDTDHGKNLIGSFWQPERVYMDMAVLTTLPEREFANGMAEVIKSAAIWSMEEFEVLERSRENIRRALKGGDKEGKSESEKEDQELLLRVVSSSVRMKAHVVTVDERESGLRGLLNFGHTLGHALEAIVTPYMLHGECVSIGCVLEAELSHRLGYMNANSVGRLAKCFKQYELPISYEEAYVSKMVPPQVLKRVTLENMMNTMKVDKKNVGNKKRVVLLSEIGDTVEEQASRVEDDVVREVLAKSVEVFGIESTEQLQKRQGVGKGGNEDSAVVIIPPGSKSISNRALILAALGKGKCKIHNMLHSDDTQVMLDALVAMGACKVSWEQEEAEDQQTEEVLVIEGGGGEGLVVPDRELYLGNAGTAARFLTTFVNLIVTEQEKTTVLTGNSRMKERPIGALVDALRSNGCEIEYQEKKGSLPLKVRNSTKGLPGGKVELSASISSQYVSSLLMCAPYAQQEIELELVGDQVISQSYIDMTIAMMSAFGVNVEKLGDKNTHRYRIPKSSYTNPAEYRVESDASSATYPLALAAITGTKCTIPNIGSGSLQGDAKFAVDVLRPMGCDVVQTKNSTTVQGPALGGLKPLPMIDMEPMTDAFLTATALAAVATAGKEGTESITKIRGIANQHVKECDRIVALSTELAKLGIKTEVDPDGIDVKGISLDELNDKAKEKQRNETPVVIHCYDDHRVAMSLSVLASVVRPGLVFDERRCVGKTWPQWWTALTTKYKICIRGCDIPTSSSSSAPELTAAAATEVKTSDKKEIEKKTDSILIIGMRGVGKSTLGLEMANVLGYNFIDMDTYLEEQHKKTIPEIIADDGWDGFRTAEAKCLATVLSNKDTNKNTVISCGGGLLENKLSSELVMAWKNVGNVVLHLYADINQVSEYLGRDKTRPAYKLGESPQEVFARRLADYKRHSTHTLYVHSEPEFGWGQMVDDAIRMIQFVTAGTNVIQNLSSLQRSFFVSLTCADVCEYTKEQIGDITAGCNAVELRVDLLLNDPRFSANKDSAGKDLLGSEQQVEDFELYVLQQVAALRRRTSLPIVYTVRSKSQGGNFPNNQQLIERLLIRGVEFGCEYIDVEMGGYDSETPADCSLLISVSTTTRKSAYYKHSQILASYHDPTGLNLRWTITTGSALDHLKSYLWHINKYADIGKLVSFAWDWDDNLRAVIFANKLRTSAANKPLIVINMSYVGQFSRILCPLLTPVTHPSIKTPAAPGQLSVAQIHHTLHTMGALPSKRFYLFGDPISKSPSPAMHNAAFEYLGLPHNYSLYPVNLGELDAQKLKEFAGKVLRGCNGGTGSGGENKVNCGYVFGGASVTIPNKQSIIPLLDELTDAAKAIGAVNTIIPIIRTRLPSTSDSKCSYNAPHSAHAAPLYIDRNLLKMVGDNTDYLGMISCIKNANSLLSTPLSLNTVGTNNSLSALVIGAGGTSRAAIYALHKLNVANIYLYNRTLENAEKLASSIDFTHVTVLSSLSDPQLLPAHPFGIIISTIPAPSQSTVDSSDYPSHLFSRSASQTAGSNNQSSNEGIVLDMAYTAGSTLTPLLTHVQTSHPSWKLITGLQVLIAQGVEQFKLWNGPECAPPVRQMTEAVYAFNSFLLGINPNPLDTIPASNSNSDSDSDSDLNSDSGSNSRSDSNFVASSSSYQQYPQPPPQENSKHALQQQQQQQLQLEEKEEKEINGVGHEKTKFSVGLSSSESDSDSESESDSDSDNNNNNIDNDNDSKSTSENENKNEYNKKYGHGHGHENTNLTNQNTSSNPHLTNAKFSKTTSFGNLNTMAANNSQNLDTAVASDISSYNETTKKLNESLNGHLDTNADVDADTDPNVGVNIDPVEETIVHLNQTQLENRNDNENENENDRGKKLFTVSSSSFSSGSSTPSPNLMPNSNQNSTPVSASGPGSKPNSNPNPNSSPNLDSELKSDVHSNALSREGEDLHDSGSTTSKNRSIHGISELDNKAQQKSNQFDTTNNTLEKKTSLERAKTAEITNSALNLKNTSSGTNLLKTLHKTNKNSSSRASITSITTATIATAIPTTTTTTTAVSVSAPSNSINDPNTIKNSTTNSDNSNNLAGTRKLSNSKTTSYYNTKRLLHSISKISTNSTTNTTATRSPLSGRSSAYSHTSPSIVAEAGAVGDSGRLQRPHLERATSKFGNLIPTQHSQHDSVGKSGNSSNASYKKPKRFLPRASTTTDAKIQQQLQQQQHHHHIQQEQLSPVLRSASLSTSSRWQQDLDYLTSSVQRQYQRERELGMLEAEQEHNLEMAMKYTCIRSLHQVETISSALMLNAPVKNNISSTTMTASSPHSDLRVTHDSDSFDSGSGSGVGGDSNAIQLSTNKIYRDIDDAYTFVAQRSDPLASSKQRSKKLLQVFKDFSNFSTDTTINHSSENSNNNSNLGNSTNANGDITNANNFTEKQNSCILPPSLDYFLGTNSYSGYYPTYGSQSHSYSHGNPYGYGGSSYSLDKTKKIPVWLQPLPREIHDIYYSTDPDSPVRDDRIPHEPPHLKFLNSRAAELKMAMRQNAAASKEKIVAPPRLITSSISALETWKGRRVPGLVNLNCYIGDAGSTLLNRQN